MHLTSPPAAPSKCAAPFCIRNFMASIKLCPSRSESNWFYLRLGIQTHRFQNYPFLNHHLLHSLSPQVQTPVISVDFDSFSTCSFYWRLREMRLERSVSWLSSTFPWFRWQMDFSVSWGLTTHYVITRYALYYSKSHLSAVSLKWPTLDNSKQDFNFLWCVWNFLRHLSLHIYTIYKMSKVLTWI